jgi:hypothetical protein
MELISPDNLDLNKVHVLSLLFGTPSETEVIKCGWDKSNISADDDPSQTAAYFSRQHDLTPINTIY